MWMKSLTRKYTAPWAKSSTTGRHRQMQQGHPSERSNRLMFRRRQYRLRYTPAICALDKLSHTHAREAAGKSRDGELIHLKSFFTPPHHPHCDLNTILVTAVTESLKSTQLSHLFLFSLPSPRLFSSVPTFTSEKLSKKVRTDQKT